MKQKLETELRYFESVLATTCGTGLNEQGMKRYIKLKRLLGYFPQAKKKR